MGCGGRWLELHMKSNVPLVAGWIILYGHLCVELEDAIGWQTAAMMVVLCFAIVVFFFFFFFCGWTKSECSATPSLSWLSDWSSGIVSEVSHWLVCKYSSIIVTSSFAIHDRIHGPIVLPGTVIFDTEMRSRRRCKCCWRQVYQLGGGEGRGKK